VEGGAEAPVEPAAPMQPPALAIDSVLRAAATDVDRRDPSLRLHVERGSPSGRSFVAYVRIRPSAGPNNGGYFVDVYKIQ
jgi:hypothetical protein